jgi:hypothetical protein
MILYKKILVIYPQLTQQYFLPGGVIQLANEGNGDFIKAWTHPTLVKPTQLQLDYANTQPEPITTEEKDQADLTAAKTYAKLNALKNMTPAEIQTWVTNNVTTLAQAKDVIITLGIAVSILARRL